jgi:1-acyl-sn-glycerol-3-phosphate acyltransferase
MWTLAVLGLAAAAWLVRWRRSRMSLADFLLLDVARAYVHLWHRWSCNRREPLPATGPAILYANHTCSADPMFLSAATRRHLAFLAAQEHYNLHPFTRRLLDHLRCVPVTRNGRDVTAARTALSRLRDGCVVCLFPEGGLSGIAHERLRRPKLGVALLALRSRAPVFPAYIAGGPRTHKLLRSWLMPSPRNVRVLFGPAVDLSAYYGRPIDRRLLEEVSELLMRRVADLRPSREGDCHESRNGK